MLTREEFEKLVVGDVVVTDPIFMALDPEEATHFTVVEAEVNERDFLITYQGVELGKVLATLSGNSIKWEFYG